MNEATLRRLAQNPHYKMSAAQKAELERLKIEQAQADRKPMVEFGQTPIHQRNGNEIEKHDVRVVKRGRTKK